MRVEVIVLLTLGLVFAFWIFLAYVRFLISRKTAKEKPSLIAMHLWASQLTSLTFGLVHISLQVPSFVIENSGELNESVCRNLASAMNVTRHLMNVGTFFFLFWKLRMGSNPLQKKLLPWKHFSPEMKLIFLFNVLIAIYVVVTGALRFAGTFGFPLACYHDESTRDPDAAKLGRKLSIPFRAITYVFGNIAYYIMFSSALSQMIAFRKTQQKPKNTGQSETSSSTKVVKANKMERVVAVAFCSCKIVVVSTILSLILTVLFYDYFGAFAPVIPVTEVLIQMYAVVRTVNVQLAPGSCCRYKQVQ